MRGQRNDLRAPAVEIWVRANLQGTNTHLGEGRKDGVNFLFRARAQNIYLLPNSLGRGLDFR